MKHQLFVVILSLAVASLLWAGASNGDDRKYTEDFTSTQYKDTLNTTAWWDTTSGELKLYPFSLSIAGSYDTPNIAYSVAISGDYAYVADGSSGLLVIDISDPTAPSFAGSYDTPGDAYGIAVSGDYAYVADKVSGLQVIDISEPATPSLAGSYDTPGDAWAVAIWGDRAYVADGSSGLQVIDISDPSTPAPVGSYDTPDLANGVAISGNYAYVADDVSGLQVIDISDPSAPSLAGSYDTPGHAQGVAVSGDYAYVADHYIGLQVIDISDPSAPSLAGSYLTPENAWAVTVSGDCAYVADGYSGLQVIDISDPSTPLLAGSCDMPDHAWGVVVSGDYAYMADHYSGLQVIDIGDPSFAGGYYIYIAGYDQGVAIWGDYAYVACGDAGLQVIDISDPTVPSLGGSYDTPGHAHGMAIWGDYAFVGDYGPGLQVIDISDPSAPSLAGSCDTPGNAWGVAISGDYAYVADRDSGLQVIDISDPTAPLLAGSCDTPGDAWEVTISGDYAYMADRDFGLQVIDISNPISPLLVGSYNPYPFLAEDVAISGDHALVASGSSGLQVIDISDPTAPSLVGSYDTPGYARGLAVSGDYIYVADNDFGLQVIDISDPTAPLLARSYDTPSQAADVAISGEYAYVADGNLGFMVIQVSQMEFDTEHNKGWSLVVEAETDTIFGTRLTTTQTADVTWELSADGGSNWQSMLPNGNWDQLTVPGTDLVWRSTHVLAEAGVNPAVSQLEIDWLVAAASIDSIVDVPADQGRWIRIFFTRSGRDFAGELSLPIEDYGIWQRVDDPVMMAALSKVSSCGTKRQTMDGTQHPTISIHIYQGRTYVQSRSVDAASSFPGGTWEWVATVPAIQRDTYIARLATTADSSGAGPNYAVFVITAHTTTPSIWYVSEPDSGYSLDNIPPAVPTGFAVAYCTGSGNHLTWDPCPDEDFQNFRVYRSSDPYFVPAPGDLVHTTAATNWNDPDYDGWGVYYKITACDCVGNESGAASPGTITAVTEQVPPKTYVLYPNVPNPFNPTTLIRYDVPAEGGRVTLCVYDVGGRLVRTLVNGMEAAGEKHVSWDGRNEDGRGVAAGVYFYQMTAPGFEMTHKMVMMK